MPQLFPLAALPLALSLPVAPGSAAAQSPLTARVDWKDGRVADGVGPADATVQPEDERFWIGQGPRRAQIEIGSRIRRFDEELGSDQNYVTAIVDLVLDESSPAALDHRLFVLTAAQSTKVSMPEPGQLQMLNVEFPDAPNEVAALEVDPNPMDEFHYSIQAIDLVEDEKLVVAGGFRINPNVQFSDQLVVQLYRYGPQVPNGPDTLVRIGIEVAVDEGTAERGA
jgi:hypothetical protein